MDVVLALCTLHFMFGGQRESRYTSYYRMSLTREERRAVREHWKTHGTVKGAILPGGKVVSRRRFSGPPLKQQTE